MREGKERRWRQRKQEMDSKGEKSEKREMQ